MTDITIVNPTVARPVDDGDEIPKVGRWYWYKNSEPNTDEDGESSDPVLFCCVHVGSNYVGLKSPDGSSVRVHHDQFWDFCTFEPAALTYAAGRVLAGQQTIQALMEEVRSVTARLAISVEPVLPGAAMAQDGQALAVYAGGKVDSYEKALMLAKDKTLPELFEKIKQEQETIALWLNAQLIPLKAEAGKMKPAIQKIEARIESVGLYAGLTEHIATIREGEPAATGEPVHVFQRKAYMDEECLARYETGGMDISDLGAFDNWLTRPSNLDRLMPYPRCVLAFQVRRERKKRSFSTVAGFFAMLDEEKTDGWTFLYIRNGQQVHRLRTSIEFDDNLFPDQEHNILDGHVYYDTREEKLVSAAQYADMVAAAQEEDRENDRRRREEARKPKKDRWFFDIDFKRRELKNIDVVTHASLYYDDAIMALQAEMARHNRMVLVLQGLLDRSTVLHPHPPWQLWSPEGFQAGLRLIYDGVRALSAGDKPDFEAYRAALNAQIRPGSVTIGQQYVWDMRESIREDEEWERRFPSRHGYRASRFDDDDETLVRANNRTRGDDPGPGQIARVFAKRGDRFEYRWLRKPRNKQEDDTNVLDKITVRPERLFNLSAYQAGDMRRFFEDPRTRAEYLKWAPVLILAEEYVAGNLTVQEPALPPPKKPRGPIDVRAKWRRDELKARKAMVGKVVELRCPLTTQKGKSFKAGTLWYVEENERGGLVIALLDSGLKLQQDLQKEYRPYIRVSGLSHTDLKERVDLLDQFKQANKRERE